MPTTEFLSPGVYGIEKAPARATEGISAASMGIVGWTEQGPVDTPYLVRSVEEFTELFGDLNNTGIVALAMRAFFNTGGERAWVVRVAPADAVTADVDVDSPTKWTFTARGPGAWGNNVTIRIRGNRNFLDRTVSPPVYTKFDLLVLVPSDFDPTLAIADEFYEAVQFTDALASDYVVAAMTDPRNPSFLVDITEAAGGTPTGVSPTLVQDQSIGTGAPPQTQFTGTLTPAPVLDLTLRIVAGGAQVNDEAQTLTVGTINGTNTTFEMTLPGAPALDGSVRLFYAQNTPISNFALPVTGLINGVNTVYTVAAAALSPVHKETTVFRIKYAPVGGSTGPNLLFTDGGGGGTLDLSTTPVTVGLPVHPGTLSITLDVGGAQTITDDGAGNLTGTGGSLPGGGTINYDTGAMTGVTGSLTASSAVNETHYTSSVITKAVTVDNLATALALGGAVSVGTMGLVNSVTSPTGSGAMSFTTTAAPDTGTLFYVDYVRLRIINSSVAGALTGDVGVGTNTVDFETGDIDVETVVPPRTGTTIDADYQTGLVVTDDGLGNLVGDVDAAGANTINYETGAFDVTFSSAPLVGSSILANYTRMPAFADYPLTGGTNGTAVTRAVISAPALEASQRGIYAFDQVEDTLNIVVPDFEGSTLVQQDIVDYCEARLSRFAILGFATGTTYQEAIQYVLVTALLNTRCAAIYWPNIYFVNEATNRPEIVPVTPFIAGIYAKTARLRNVGKAPGGITDGVLDGDGTVGPEFARQVMDINIRNALYQSRINPLFNSQATGFVVWGVRTLSTDTRWRYVQARTLNDFLMESIRRQLQWAVFEGNGPNLWLKIETTIKGYMSSLWRLGYFAGVTEDQAYFVKCNRSNNTQATIDSGKVIIDIGFSPFKPAEFVIFQLTQPASFITI